MPDYLRPVPGRQNSSSSHRSVMYEKKKVEFNFEFDNPYEHLLDSHPVFLREDGIQGNVNVTISTEDVKIDKVELVLKGSIRQSIHHECDRWWRPYKFAGNAEIFRLVDVQMTHILNAHEQPAGTTESFPFQFSLYSDASANTSVEDEHRPKQIPPVLPSSHCLRSFDGSWCEQARPLQFGQQRAKCRVESVVEYELQAFAHCGDHKIQGQGIAVTIYDAPNNLGSSSRVTSLAPKRRFTQNVEFKREIAGGKKRRAHLTAEIREPSPTSVFKSGALASVPVRFVLSDIGGGANDDTPPAPIKVCLDSFLTSSTAVSVCPQTPDSMQSRIPRPWTANLQRYGRSFNATFEIGNWQRASCDEKKEGVRVETASISSTDSSRPSSITAKLPKLVNRRSQRESTSSPSSRSWMAETTLLIPLAFTSSIPPSFTTAHVSRDYTISIQLDLVSNTANKRLSIAPAVKSRATRMQFNVPVQIVYPSENGVLAPSYEIAMRRSANTTPALSRRNSNARGFVHGPERLPVYVR